MDEITKNIMQKITNKIISESELRKQEMKKDMENNDLTDDDTNINIKNSFKKPKTEKLKGSFFPIKEQNINQNEMKKDNNFAFKQNNNMGNNRPNNISITQNNQNQNNTEPKKVVKRYLVKSDGSKIEIGVDEDINKYI